jgi:hypothetical protein
MATKKLNKGDRIKFNNRLWALVHPNGRLIVDGKGLPAIYLTRGEARKDAIDDDLVVRLDDVFGEVV